MKRVLLATALTILVSGCVVAPTDGGYVTADGQEVLPPLPTFSSLADCEMAYGYGACGTGSQVYARASLAPPSYATYWYMPYQYAGLTGALTYYHLAQPTVYVSSIPYRTYVSPVYVDRYRVVTPVVVQRYHAMPVQQREVLVRQGPAFPSPGHQHSGSAQMPAYKPAQGATFSSPQPSYAPARAGYGTPQQAPQQFQSPTPSSGFSRPQPVPQQAPQQFQPPSRATGLSSPQPSVQQQAPMSPGGVQGSMQAPRPAASMPQGTMAPAQQSVGRPSQPMANTPQQKKEDKR